jgi:hypothetical protein
MFDGKLNGREYHPGSKFDALFGEFVDLAVKESWSFPGTSLDDLRAAVTAQQEERSALAALEAEYLSQYKAFVRAQWSRYHLFSGALRSARGMFRSNQKLMAALERFKRTIRRGKKEEESPPPAEPKTTA